MYIPYMYSGYGLNTMHVQLASLTLVHAGHGIMFQPSVHMEVIESIMVSLHGDVNFTFELSVSTHTSVC